MEDINEEAPSDGASSSQGEDLSDPEAEAEEEGDGNKKSFTSKHLYYYRCYHTVLTSYLLALYYSINLLCDASSALRIILHLLPAYSYIINII